ncbi:hypothetical protein CCR75_002036 [Bremia lactucae]|uniref:RING-type domain-containing protein n=1 Tax=Bremia lactucae TaxID=4779 RepID=A0A976IAY8_BRELC|nr:hypothetical protein CCR75_002036 [Bremia lactucae]
MTGENEEISLWRAAQNNNISLLWQITDKKPISEVQVLLNLPHPIKGTTPLMVAATKADGTKITRTFIEFGAHLDVADNCKYKNSALHYAAYNNRSDQLELLLAAGANMFALNAKGHTALDVARLRGRKEAAATLTSRLQVHCDWLYLRSKSVLGFWKRRWCVLLACNVKQTSTELCIFRGPNKAHPKAVIWQDTLAHTCTPFKSEKGNGFELDTQIVYQNLGGRRYSRYRSSGRTHVHKPNLQPIEFLFACDSEAARDAWMDALGGQLCGGDSTNTAISSSYMGSPHRMSRVSRDASVDATRLTGRTSPVDIINGIDAPTQATVPSLMITQGPYRASAPTFIEDDDGHIWGDLSWSRAVFAQESHVYPIATVITLSGDPNEPQPVLVDRCIVCANNSRDSVCVPCGHVAGCLDCMRAVTYETSSCPVCRAHVDGVVRI